MLKINDIKYKNDSDADIDRILLGYSDFKDPLEAVLDDIGINIFRHAAIRLMEDAQEEGWIPPKQCRKDNILGCVSESFAGSDADDCLKTLDITIYDILEDPKKYKYLTKD
jgi:hypothetical protein